MSDAESFEGCDDFLFLFFGVESRYYFNAIPFVISIETEASLLALAKSVYHILTEKVFLLLTNVAPPHS